MPKIQEVLSHLNKCKYFSSLDLCPGYFCISLTEEAKKKTAFVTADGHRISANGLEPLPEKLEAIRNLAPARNVDEACHILGLLGYYRSCIPAFVHITLPITSLLKKNTPFIWSDKCQQALEYLKEIFYNKPLLQFPDPNKPYILYTDASNNAYSGILCQPVNSN